MKKFYQLAMLCFGVCGSFGNSKGCGLSLELPRDHFDGVNEKGYVSYWEKLGAVSIDDRNVLTICLGFDSHQEALSPYFGKGWSLPILEAHVEPIDENNFMILMPNGLNYYFGRMPNQMNMYSGNMGWKAFTEGETLTAWAPCGWKVTFQNGKIWEMTTPDNTILSFRYNGGVATEVVAKRGETSERLVAVDFDSATGKALDISILGKKISISLGKRPQVVSNLKQNLITGFDPSLNKLQWLDGKIMSCSFSTDTSLNPTLAITCTDHAQRNFTWDPTSRLIKTDGIWSYNIGIAGIDIKRTSNLLRFEHWLVNFIDGLEISEDSDSKVITHTFTYGLLAGRTRSIDIIKGSAQPTHYLFAYNEHGALIRETMNSKIIVKNDFDTSDRIVESVSDDGHEVSYTYDAQDEVIEDIDKGRLREVVNKSGALVSITDKDNYSLTKADLDAVIAQ